VRRIRPFKIADRSRLVRTIDAVCGEGRWMSTTRFEPTESWLHALAEPRCSCHSLLVVEDAKKIVGWCRLFPREDTGMQETILGIGLLPAYRDRGIGTALVRQSLEWARDVGHGQVQLTTHPGNARAIHVFSRCGFSYAGRVRDESIEMTCGLQAPLDM
jgi:RimJ/RimL family protein N-acetyltransferase